MTKEELSEIEKFEGLPPDVLTKLQQLLDEPIKTGEETAVSFDVEGQVDLDYSDDILNSKVIDEDLKYSKDLLEDVMETLEFPLDKALDSYDPSFPGYSPSKESFEFFTLMRLVEGQDFDFDTPIAHYFMVDLLLNNITDASLFPYSDEICNLIDINHLRIAFMCSRGVAKSSVVISFFGVYSAIKGELNNGIGKVWFYLVLAASSRGGARVNALAVRAMCEDSVFLKDYFESMRFTESESEFVRKGSIAKKHRSFLIRYQGVGTGVRGIRYGERRICAIINDDIILNEAASYSKVISENLESLMHADSISALKGGGKGRILNCFTPFSYTDVNTQLVLNGAYTPCIIPLAKTINVEKPNLVVEDITSTWESMHPRKSILMLINEAKKTKKLSKFMQERMLRLTSADTRLIPDSCIQFCDMKPIMDNIHGYATYITTDFTTTSGEKSDFSGIATWAVSNNEDWFLLHVSLRKRTMDEQYEETLNQAATLKRRGKDVEIGVEVDGNQASHVLALEKLMMKRGDFYNFARQKGDLTSTRKGLLSKSTGVRKHERFRIASQVFMQRKIWFPEHLKGTTDMDEFLQQIRGATHESFTRADDGPDLISMAICTMHVVYPTEVSYAQVTTDDTSVPDIWGDEPGTEEESSNSMVF